MDQVEFGNGRALKINNTLLITEIINKVENYYNLEIDNKRYHFLNKEKAQELRNKQHSFILNTYGHKYLVFLTHINLQKYCLFINRTTKDIYLVKMRFYETLYFDTIFEGELIKIKSKYYFLISDVLIYETQLIINKPFHLRREKLNDLLLNYSIDSNLEPITLLKKDVFSYQEINDVLETYIPSLPFKVNGFLFKSHEISCYDILYIFPECVKKKDPSQKPKLGKIEIKIDKTDQNFLMKKMEVPDLYELGIYQKQQKKYVKITYAFVPTIEHSKKFRKWFENADKDDEGYPYIYVNCHKDEITEKWLPIQVLNSV